MHQTHLTSGEIPPGVVRNTILTFVRVRILVSRSLYDPYRIFQLKSLAHLVIHGDVEAHDIPLLQWPVIWNSMTRDLIHTSAYGLQGHGSARMERRNAAGRSKNK